MDTKDLVCADKVYCSLCDKYFHTLEGRADHLRWATNHPRCEKCNLRFMNLNSLRNHYVLSRRHHYCTVCNLEFNTSAGFRAHLEFASIHRGRGDDDDVGFENDVDDSYDGWEEEAGRTYFPDTAGLPPMSDMSDDDSDDDDDDDDDEEPPPPGNFHAGAPPTPVSHSTPGTTPISVPLLASSSSSSSSPSSPSPPPSDAVEDFKHPHELAECTSSAPLPPRAASHPRGLGCRLCHGKMDSPTALRCGHMFCAGCVRGALEKEMVCPCADCRRPAKWQHLRRLFVTPVSSEV